MSNITSVAWYRFVCSGETETRFSINVSTESSGERGTFSKHILRPSEARLLVQQLQDALAGYEAAEGEREA